MFLSTEIFSKRQKIYAWFEEKPELTYWRNLWLYQYKNILLFWCAILRSKLKNQFNDEFINIILHENHSWLWSGVFKSHPIFFRPHRQLINKFLINKKNYTISMADLPTTNAWHDKYIIHKMAVVNMQIHYGPFSIGFIRNCIFYQQHITLGLRKFMHLMGSRSSWPHPQIPSVD